VIAGLVPIAIAAIGASYAVLVFRGSRRRDNVVFGLLALTDAGMTAWRGLNVLTGGSIVAPGVLVPCAIGTVALAVISIEFITAFPDKKPMSWRWRGLLFAWAAFAVFLLAIEPHDKWSAWRLSELLFFIPATGVVAVIGLRTFRRTDRREVKAVIGMLWFRWAFGLAAYYAGPIFGVFEALVWVETTFATLASFVFIGSVVLRSELFSIRGAAAEVVAIAAMAIVVVLGGGAALWAALRYTEPGQWQVLALFVATFVPLALAALLRRLYPRLEHRVLAGLDERRARRLGVQGEPIPADADAAIAEACHRIAAIANGATVRFEPASALPAAVADVLRNGEPLRKAGCASKEGAGITTSPHLSSMFAVPALGGPAPSGSMTRGGAGGPASSGSMTRGGADRALVGAFMIDGGLIDRDTYLVARDLAARIALVVERAQAVSALEDARRLAALGQFAAAIAHDIRTPLTSISLNVQILRRKLQLPDDDREHLDIALEELERLDKSVGEILEFAKPVKLMSQAIDVGELIETAARGLTPVLTEKNIGLRCEPSDALTVQGDPQRLRQVLVNLVDNAADASTPGAQVTVRAGADGERVAIEVEDHGRGIAATDLPRIFDPFFTTRRGGSGLGLAIARNIIEGLGGTITIDSQLGTGTTVRIELPDRAPGAEGRA
jgi:signal transduction histidine kinase